MFCFYNFFGTIDVKNDLHICIVLFEVSRAIFSTYFLYYVVMMLWYVLTLFEKKHLSIQAWVRVMLVSVCKYHPLVLSLSLFLTCDISLGYMDNQRENKQKNIFKKLKQDKHSRYLVPFVKPCWCCDSAARKRERGCTASRLKGWGNIFVTECKSYSEGGKGTSYEGTASFH